MKIALDVMGGDYAPENNILGLKEAMDECKFVEKFVLVGQSKLIAEQLDKHRISDSRIELHEASQVVEMKDPSTICLRQKKDSSITVCSKLMKEGHVNAIVSAGHTGAAVASTVVLNRMINGIERPGIATVFPSEKGAFVALDVGANVDCKPINLSQYAIMGNVYSNQILGVENPRIGILSVGAEDGKGNELTRESFSLIEKLPLNFVGNVEGHDLFSGHVDVVVCDGFVGNVLLKSCESLAKSMANLLREQLSKTPVRKAGAILSSRAFKDLKKVTDYEEYGGAPLLGINGTCIIAHGSSSPKAIKNAIRVCSEMVIKDVNAKISEGVNQVNWTDLLEKEAD